ncbi:MAG: ATP-dependent Clp protease ATP-binding subunit [Candidatus Zixiibacteriota bacterium]
MDIANYSSDSRAIIKNAKEVAISFKHAEIDVEHLLMATVRHEGTEVESILNQLGKAPRFVESILEIHLKDQASRATAREKMAISPAVQTVLQQAVEEKVNFQDTLVEPEHILIAIFDPKSALSPYVRDKLGIIKEDIYKAIAESKAVEEIASTTTTTATDGKPSEQSEKKVAGTLRYCTDMTNLAASDKFDPLIGREDEVQQTIQILMRRRKNSPVLVGGAGVGKSAIVEGFAKAVIDKKVPKTLQDVKVMEVDMGSLVAGAKYKGEFEERFKSLVGDVVKSGGKIILFIDEIHTIAGAGSGGGMDAANLIKPALARGQIRLIGATTEEEYTKYLEKDKALDRRFERIKIEQPNFDEAVKIVSGVVQKYEEHHKVTYTPESLSASVKLAKKYLSERNLPDVALDIIDEAASEYSVKKEFADEKVTAIPEILGQTESLFKTIAGKDPIKNKEDFDKFDESFKILAHDVERLQVYWGHRLEATTGEPLGQLKFGPDETEKALSTFRERYEALKTVVENLEPKIVEADIAAVIARRTGIPVAKMMTAEKDRLVKMEEYLAKKIIGQKDAISAISNAIRKSRAGLKLPNRPVGSFLFLGPTGTGKTHLPKLLAEFLFDDKNAMVRLDMSEYMEPHSVAKMIGAPPGYVGYEAGGVLTEAVRRKPFSIVLLDEVEKAHPDVFNVLLQLMDDGRLTDGQSRTVDFSNTIVVLTSNYAAEKILDADREGREVDMDEVRTFLFSKFRPELLNRLNDIIIYHSFTLEQVEKIAVLEFNQLCQLLKEQNIKATLTVAGQKKIAADGYTVELGARPIQRTIEKDIIYKLSVDIITGTINPGDTVEIDVKDNEYVFNIVKETK